MSGRPYAYGAQDDSKKGAFMKPGVSLSGSVDITGVSIIPYQGMNGLEALREKWKDVLSGMTRRRFFHLWEWHHSYLECLETEPDAMFFFLFSEGDTPVAVFPLRLSTISKFGVRFNRWTFPSHNHLLLSDIICREDAIALPLFQIFTRYLRRRKMPWDVICLAHLLEDACAVRVLRTHANPKTLLQTEGRCDFTDTVGGYETLSPKLSRNFRKSIKQARKHLYQLPDIAVTFAAGRQQLEDGLEAFMAVESSGWKGLSGTGTAIALHPELVRFYRELTRSLSVSGHIRINTISAGERCIAAQFCIVEDDAVYMLKIGYDEAYRRCAPGKILNELFIQKCMADSDINFINYVTDAAWHKDWSPESYTKSLCYVFNGSAAGMLGLMGLKLSDIVKDVYQRRLKPRISEKIQKRVSNIVRRVMS